MGSKGQPGCCCTPCQTRSGCANGDGLGGNFLENHCCSCLPTRVCVVAYAGEYVVGSLQLIWDCDNQQYSTASYIVCDDLQVQIALKVYKDDYGCYMCVVSEALGVGYGDNCIPFVEGYTEEDGQPQKSKCLSQSWDFDLYGASGNCGITRIEARPASYTENIPKKQIFRPEDTSCIYDRVCIRVNDGYEEYVLMVCRDEDGSYRTIIEGDRERFITISVHQVNPTQLTLLSYLGDDSTPRDVICPYMSYSWDLGDGKSISIVGDRFNDCTDCKCFCSTLCVSITNTETYETVRTTSSYDDYRGGWPISLGDEDLVIEKVCVGCDNPTTKLALGDQQVDITCPDLIAASFSYEAQNGVMYSVSIECAGCDECPVIGSDTTCCPDRSSLIPVTLFATITDNVDCSNLDGTVVVLNNISPAGDSNIWTGTKVVGIYSVTLTLKCDNDVWRLYPTNVNTAFGEGFEAVSASCEPLDLTFIGVGPGNGCDGGITGFMDVEVTE